MIHFRVVHDNINWSLSKDRSNQMLQFETDKKILNFHGQTRATLNHDQKLLSFFLSFPVFYSAFKIPLVLVDELIKSTNLGSIFHLARPY